MTRNIGDLVKKEDFVLDSEYLTTLIVVVPQYVLIVTGISVLKCFILRCNSSQARSVLSFPQKT